MSTRRLLRHVMAGLMVVVSFWANSAVRAAEQGGQPVLVIPARPRVVQFAQDLVRLKPVTLISAQAVPGGDQVVLHVWSGSDWRAIEWESFRRGSFPVLPTGPLLIVGDRTMVPADVADEALWASAAKRVETVKISDLINFFGSALDLSARQMRWLSKRYDVELTDLNADRRRYGRYGRPDQVRREALPPLRQPTEAPKGDGKAMPPAPPLPAPASGVRSSVAPAESAAKSAPTMPEKAVTPAPEKPKAAPTTPAAPVAPAAPAAPVAPAAPAAPTPGSTLPSPVFPEDK